ncbi:hypothetical protein COL516b_002187 [Colletotrichum fioriniae]|nr:uncharacterized protein COL516b_002187 [Colletotrichum fioriniae]KAJ0310386.1 hypothetical protein COL516b_002187 [Colletotrichum fioriniae]
MKQSFTFLAAAFGVASANPHLAAAHLANPHFRRASPTEWTPAGPNDFRGPCPMMNTLANHGFISHDGKNLTKDVVVKGLQDGLNFGTDLGTLMFNMALIANPEPNATFFTLRTDAAFGNNHVFNQSIFDESRAYWTKDTLDAQQLANSKLARQVTSRAFNPNYTFTATVENFSLGEVAAPIIVFGDMAAGTVNKTLVEYFFQNERLPAELGWVKKENAVTQEDILKVVEMIRNATVLTTGGAAEAPHKRMIRDLHTGLGLLSQ